MAIIGLDIDCRQQNNVSDSLIVIRQSAISTLHRLSMYLHFSSISSFFIHNLAHVVDESCANLRCNAAVADTNDSMSRYSTAFGVLELVLDTVGYQAFLNNQSFGPTLHISPLILIRDTVLNTLDNIDKMAAVRSLSHDQVSTLSYKLVFAYP